MEFTILGSQWQRQHIDTIFDWWMNVSYLFIIRLINECVVYERQVEDFRLIWQVFIQPNKIFNRGCNGGNVFLWTIIMYCQSS
jgi:hypothetical protein